MEKNQEESQERKGGGVFRKLSRLIGSAINTFESVSLIVGVCSLAVLLILNFLARNFYKSIYFAEELAEFLVIFISFVGVSYGVRRARHIRMGAFLDMMPPKMEKVFIIFISAVSAVVLFYLSYLSYEYLFHSMNKGHETPALRLPYWIFYVIVPIGFFMAAVQYVRTIIKNIVEPGVWMSPEQQSEYDDEDMGVQQ